MRTVIRPGTALVRIKPIAKAIALALAGSALYCSITAPIAWAQQPAAKRLSDWLLAQPYSTNAYHLGLSWRVAGEIPAQHALRLELLEMLTAPGQRDPAQAEARRRLRAWLESLPITGRVPVAVADARWLQANPLRDPILLSSHSVDLPDRPRTVTVLKSDGSLCAVTHAPGRNAEAYVRACEGKNSAIDWAWVAQPDGRLQRYGIAAWNRERMDNVAPGAWLWGPTRGSGWPELFSQQLITFLATQGPAPDRDSARPPPKRANDITTNSKEMPRHKAVMGGQAIGFGGTLNTTKPLGASTLSVSVSDAILGSPPPSGDVRIPFANASNWGYTGLLQTPSARMPKAGYFGYTMSRTLPYTVGNVFFQPLDWLEAGFRYVDISNRITIEKTSLVINTYKDKSFDAKVRLWPESAYLPQVAIGIRDAAGTGLFSGEYVVASKRTGMLDWSMGMGWGNFSAATRHNAVVGVGGTFSVKNYFRGPAKPFGGVHAQTPWEKVSLKVEYDSNTYQNEPLANAFKRRSPWNLGLVFRAGDSANFTIGIERGNTLMLGFSLNTQLDGLSIPKLLDPPKVSVSEARPKAGPADWSAVAQVIKTQTAWQVTSISADKRELRLKLDDAAAPHMRDRVDRASAVLHATAPPEVDRFVYTYRELGTDTAEHVVDRDAWVNEQTQPTPPSHRQNPVIARAPTRLESATPLHRGARQRFETDYRLGFQPIIGGVDSFVLFQGYAEGTGKLWVRDDTWVQGSLQLRLFDNYGKLKTVNDSVLPHVRTLQKEFLTTSRLTMPTLQLTHTGKLDQNQYYSLYGGMLESMYGGIGGEWLYRPFASRLAIGVDANVVRQRDFHQDLRFRDYQVKTGHATAYWETGWNDVLATVSAGRYLAGDRGMTFQVSRTWSNGVTLGAYATKTNVSAEQFGEGSFDKGAFLSIPLDVAFLRSSPTTVKIGWKPLTRDGGAKLNRSVQLYDATRLRSDRALEIKAAPLPNDAVPPHERREPWQPISTSSVPAPKPVTTPVATQVESGSSDEFRLIEALYQQGYRNTTVQLDNSNRLKITLSHDQLSPESRAVGRAARTILPLTPHTTRELHITLLDRADPVVKYEFLDLDRLRRYFAGAVKPVDLMPTVSVDWINPGARANNPLAMLDDTEIPVKPNPLSTLAPEGRMIKRAAADFANAGRVAVDANWVQAGLVAGSVLFASSKLDKRADQFVKDHPNSSAIKNVTRIGNVLPWAGLAGAAVLALDTSDPTRARTSFAAAEASVSALALATGLKYAVGRSRPQDGLGSSHFNAFGRGNGNTSFPSRHSATAWAVLTPYALQYDMPWLYGAAMLTNLGRVGGRNHWVSDTVGGSLIGYGMGRLFWEASRNKNMPHVMVGRNNIQLSWETN